MNKIIYIIVLFFSLFSVEIIINYVFAVIYGMIIMSDNREVNTLLFYTQCFDAVILWNLWRLIFFGFPYILFYIFTFNYFKKIKTCKPLIYSIFNTFVYLLLSYLSIFINGKNVPIHPDANIFWLTCISIFFAPIILSLNTYYKNLIELY